MKKLILMLCLAFLLLLASCDGGEDTQITETTTPEITTEVTTEAATEAETEFVPTEDNVLWGDPSDDDYGYGSFDIAARGSWTPGEVYIYPPLQDIMETSGDTRIAVLIGYYGEPENDPRKSIPDKYKGSDKYTLYYLTADEIRAMKIGEEDRLGIHSLSYEKAQIYKKHDE